MLSKREQLEGSVAYGFTSLSIQLIGKVEAASNYYKPALLAPACSGF